MPGPFPIRVPAPRPALEGALAILFPFGRGPAREPSGGEAPLDQRILHLVRTHPGLPVGEITRRLAAGSGTVYYHLKRLERKHELRTLLAGRRRLVFPREENAPHPWQAHGLSLLRGKTASVVARAICERPGSTMRDLADAVGGSPRSVYYHVKRLREARLVELSGPRSGGLRPAPLLPRLIAQLPPPGSTGGPGAARGSTTGAAPLWNGGSVGVDRLQGDPALSE